jgi:hypothetical protein
MPKALRPFPNFASAHGDAKHSADFQLLRRLTKRKRRIVENTANGV